MIKKIWEGPLTTLGKLYAVTQNIRNFLRSLKFSLIIRIFSWALYDLANQFFILNIVSLYFVRWVTLEKGVPEIFYSLAFGISMFITAISTPFLGAVSDHLNRRMPFLVILTLISVIFTAFLGFSENVYFSLLFFAIANFGCQAAVIFYNALLADIAPENKIGFVSGLGRCFAYSGALLALYLIKPVVIKSGYKSTFLPTAFLFLIFALPCLIMIKDKPAAAPKELSLPGIKALKINFFNLIKIKGSSDYLKMCFFFLCAINVVMVFMSVYATMVFKLSESELLSLIGFSTICAVFGSIASGSISDRIGAKVVLGCAIVLWIFALLTGSLAQSPPFYWIVGICTGLALGSTWVVLRAMLVKMVPPEGMGEVFGIFNFVGYFSAIVGGLFWGGALLVFSGLGPVGYRIALFSLNIFFVFGIIFFLRLRIP